MTADQDEIQRIPLRVAGDAGQERAVLRIDLSAVPRVAARRCDRPRRTPRSRIAIRVEAPQLLPMTKEQRAHAVSLLADMLYDDFIARTQGDAEDAA